MITYHIMKDNEIDLMVKLAQEIWQEYSPCFISHKQINYMLNKFQSPKAIIDQLNSNYEYYFIKKNENIIGYFAIQPQTDTLFLSKLYIKKEHRAQKIGFITFNFIKEITKKLHLFKIKLTVNKHNTNSLETYLRWGFQIKESAQFDIGSNYIMDDYILIYNLQD